MKIFSVVVGTILMFSVPANTQAQPTSKQKTPAEVSAESADEEPDEQGMEKEASDGKLTDKSSSANGVGLDANPLGNKKSTDDDTSGTSPSDKLDEAADDILDQSFSQPGVDQNTGHVTKDRSGEAKVSVPIKSAPEQGAGLGKKHKAANNEEVEKKQSVVITDKSIIKKIQKALVKKGAQISVDGVLGETTVAAIRDFQSENGLKPDGSPGPTTMAKLGIVYIQN